VRERIAAYLTDLLSIGFSGFRVDAAKHIQPDDLAAIFSKVKRNMGGALPADFITWLEVPRYALDLIRLEITSWREVLRDTSLT
jgi:glycosidase